MAERLDVLISAERIASKVEEIAAAIDAHLVGEPLILVGVLKGSVHFLSDLSRAVKSEARIDFMQVSSYHSGKSSTGVVQIRKDLDLNIEGANVVIVEDIVDTGTTLKYLLDLLGTRSPKSLRVAALLSKPAARTHDAPVDFVGFEIPNEFVVGYGLDYAERYRNLPHIAILREE